MRELVEEKFWMRDPGRYAFAIDGKERILPTIFIVSPEYGTRCSTVLTIDVSGMARLVERSFDASGSATGEVAHLFRIESGAA